MAEANTLARPYARAAFATARDSAAFAAWSDALAFAARVAADPKVAALLGDPRLTDAVAVTLLSPPGESGDANFARFLAVLADNRRLELLPEIAGLYEALRAEAERVVKATVTSATGLDAPQLESSKGALRRRFGRDVELETAVDPGLIGGAVIVAGDVVIDGSLKGKLERLRSALAS